MKKYLCRVHGVFFKLKWLTTWKYLVYFTYTLKGCSPMHTHLSNEYSRLISEWGSQILHLVFKTWLNIWYSFGRNALKKILEVSPLDLWVIGKYTADKRITKNPMTILQTPKEFGLGLLDQGLHAMHDKTFLKLWTVWSAVSNMAWKSANQKEVVEHSTLSPWLIGASLCMSKVRPLSSGCLMLR